MSTKRSRVPGTFRRPRGTLHFSGRLPDDASLARHLGASLKTQSELEPPCICGSWPQYFAIESWDPENPRVRHLPDGPQNGELAFGVYAHESSCPVLAEAEREERELVGVLPKE
jgi:hypothetical protein